MRYLHEFRSGDIVDLGTASLSSEEITEFAERYDPQAQYLDDSIATPLYGRRVASAWQMAALCQSLFISGLGKRSALLGQSQVRDLQFLGQVGANENLRGEFHVLGLSEPEATPDRGTVSAELTLFREDDTAVLRLLTDITIARKPRH